MPAAISPIPPKALKDAMVRGGWKVVDETEYNWIVAKDDGTEPIVIPKKGRLVGVQPMQRAYHGSPREVMDAVRKYLQSPDDEEPLPDDP